VKERTQIMAFEIDVPPAPPPVSPLRENVEGFQVHGDNSPVDTESPTLTQDKSQVQDGKAISDASANKQKGTETKETPEARQDRLKKAADKLNLDNKLKREQQIREDARLAKQARDALELAKKDPIAAIKELGISPDQLKELLSGKEPKPPAVDEQVAALRKELDEYKAAATQREQAAVRAKNNETAHNIIKDMVTSDAEGKFAGVEASEAWSTVREVAERLIQQGAQATNRDEAMAIFAQAAELVEADIVREAEKYTALVTKMQARKGGKKSADEVQKAGKRIVHDTDDEISGDLINTERERVPRTIERMNGMRQPSGVSPRTVGRMPASAQTNGHSNKIQTTAEFLRALNAGEIRLD
jgi:hypothetical protein